MSNGEFSKMGRLDEMFAERSEVARQAVEPAPVVRVAQPEKIALIQKVLQHMGVTDKNVKLNAWLLRHVGTSQIMKGLE